MRVSLLGWAFLLLAAPAAAQVIYGSLVGNVRDATDASVPGALVRVTETGTGFVRQAPTNEAGGYSFANLPSGIYDVEITREGFTPFSRRAVEVTINTVVRVDAVLRPSAVTETIQVSAAAAALQTDRSEVRAEISGKTLENAPLPPGRNYLHALRVLPGFTVRGTGHGPSVDPARTPLYNVNGTSRQNNAVRIEGAGINQIWLPHLPAYTPALDAIDTVNVVTNSFDAEQGLAGGVAINLHVKSGTNEVHGSAFEFHNSNAIKAKPFLLVPGERNSKAIFNQFGGTLGGPIRRDRLFYFLSYEGGRNRQNASRLETVPTAAIRAGDMSASTNPIYDPRSGNTDGSGRTAFDDKRVPASLIEPIVRDKILPLLPSPTFSGLSANLFATGPFLVDVDRADMKLNWNASSKLTLFGRGGLINHRVFSTPILGELIGISVSTVAGTAGPMYGNTGNMAVGATYVVSPAFLVDANFGYTAYDANSIEPGLGKNIGLDVLGIPGTNGTRFFEGGWPRFVVSNYATMGAANNTTRPFFNRDPRFQYVANANWTRGSHNVRFGFDFSRQQINHTQVEFVGATHGPSGGFSFTGGPTTVRNGPASNQYNSFATFLLGLPTTIGTTLQVPEEYNVRAAQDSLYVRDQWQATRRVTITYGLRWEYFPVPRRVDRGLENYNPETNKMHVCGVGVVPLDCGIELSKRQLAPRFGLAWRATDRFVLRAGYGITYDPYSLARPMRTNYPLLLVQNINGPNSFQPAGRLRDGIPLLRPPDLGNGIIGIAGTLAANAVPEKFRRGYIQSWNFTLEKELRWGFIGQAGYVATREINRMGFLELNTAYPGQGNTGRILARKFGRTAETRQVSPVGNTHYDSLQTRLERRLSGGFQILASYTWSKAMGICCSDNSDGLPAIQLPEYYHLNRSVMGYNTPHNFQALGVWALPFGRGKRWAANGWASRLAGGWQINGLLSSTSGVPFSVSSSGTSLDAPGNSQRADLVKPTVAKLGGAGRGQSFFDPFAFASVNAVRFGTAGFNLLRGPGLVNLDLGLFRSFVVTERWKVEFRAEAFNFTNTPHFANPGGNVSNMQLNTDGSIRALGGYTEITGIANTGRDGVDERVFRFGLRLTF